METALYQMPERNSGLTARDIHAQRRTSRRRAEQRCCSVCIFLVAALLELLVNIWRRCYRSLAIGVSRCCVRCAGSSLPRHAADITADWLGRALGHPGRLAAVVLKPLAIDEGFTSALHVATLRWADEGWAEQQRLPRRVVLKMLPEWSLSEQLNSAMQLQHSKEAWVIENWAGMGCRVPRGLYTATRGASGEFIHIMEHMTDWSTGTPALLASPWPSLPLCLALTV